MTTMQKMILVTLPFFLLQERLQNSWADKRGRVRSGAKQDRSRPRPVAHQTRRDGVIGHYTPV